MSHEVETAMMGGGVAAWWDDQRNFVQKELMTPQEAAKLGGIDWEVDLVPVDYAGQETDFALIVRDKDDSVLGCVGPQYVPLQNQELIDFLTNIVDDSDLGIESAMSLKKGKVVAVCARTPEHIEIAGESYLNYLTGANWHDGTGRARFYASNVRTVCANTLRAGLASAPNVYAFRHVGDIAGRMQEAREVLQMSFKYSQEMQTVGQQLAETKMTNAEFEKFLKQLVPDPKDAEEAKKIPALQRTRDGILEVYRDTDDLENLRGTRWGAMQAVVAYNDHRRNFRSADNRFLSTLTQDNNNQRAFDLLTA